MKGRFSFNNAFLSSMLFLIFIYVPAMIMLFYKMNIIAAVVFVIGLTAAICSFYITGSYTAGSRGVKFKILFRTYRFAYKDIISVTVENSEDTHSRFGAAFTVETRLTIRTNDGTYTFRSRSGEFSMDEQIKDPSGFQQRLDELEFVRLGKFIESKIQ